MKPQLGVRILAAAAAASALAVLAPLAAADAVYHSQHMRLSPVSGAPLQSGFVENIKANGPTIYAHEVYVLNGATPNTTYTVFNNFFSSGDSECKGSADRFEMATLETNASGNGRADALIAPFGLEVGVYGVRWTLEIGGNVVYQTDCSAVTID
jgi:hypothetical protein